MVDLGTLVAKAHALRAQLAGRGVRKFKKDSSSSSPAFTTRGRQRRSNRAICAELATSAELEPMEYSESASSPHGALIHAENWSNIDIVRRRARHSFNGISTTGSSSSGLSLSLRQEQLHEYHRQEACEQPCSHKNLYKRRFHSLDCALGATRAANSATEKLQVIIEQVMDEDASREGSSGMWEDSMESTLDNASCPTKYETQKRKAEAPESESSETASPAAIRSVSNDDGRALERGLPVGGSTSYPAEVIARKTQDRTRSTNRIASSPSSGMPFTTAKELDVSERLLSTPPPPYVAIVE